uniref:Uncharacterized protein n=1 Tax=Cannabis sativa TaxID=3483 RepID=A0A803QES7_CANSA
MLRSENAYDATTYVPLVKLENRQLRQRSTESNRQNAELEREAAAARATQGTIPQNRSNIAIRRPQGRPRGPRIRRQETNQGNPPNTQEEQPRNTRDVPMDRINQPNSSSARNQEY